MRGARPTSPRGSRWAPLLGLPWPAGIAAAYLAVAAPGAWESSAPHAWPAGMTLGSAAASAFYRSVDRLSQV